ncbi:MAG TPA: FixH family protein [Burkholderiales bacterium]|nr:FixH family protein [Burkholderiales bacterium]
MKATSKLALCVALLAPLASAAQTRGDLQCKPSGKDLIYDCIVRLARADQPVTGAQLTVSAEMPSMPGEHRLTPVKARPGKGPGEYLVRLDLDMAGEWDLKLRLTGAVRDRLVLHCEFDERSGRALRRPK